MVDMPGRMSEAERERKNREYDETLRRMGPARSGSGSGSGMATAEFTSRGADLARGLYRAVVETPSRLKKLYSTPPASGPGGMKGVENTAGTAASGLGKVWQQLKDLSK